MIDAARELMINTTILNVEEAHKGPELIQKVAWKLFDRRRTGMHSFGEKVAAICERQQSDYLLVTGIAPVTAKILRRIRRSGTICANWLTDDPWNPSHRASWFLRALAEYDIVFTPRRANENQIAELGPTVYYLPFAYSPKHHFRESAPPDKQAELACDVLFFGGADTDRVPIIETIQKAGYQVHLYGGYWENWATTQSAARGHATLQQLRWAVLQAKVTLCLVRRANRDGHVMRTFEAPAMGACMLAEDTPDHRQLFGTEQRHVVLFNGTTDMIDKIELLIHDPSYRQQVAQAGHELIITGKHTYSDRLRTILDTMSRQRTARIGG